jgi:hypothetical protein
LSKRKNPKKKTSCSRGAARFPVLLIKPGGSQELALALPRLKQLRADIPRLDCAARRGRREEKPKPFTLSPTPLPFREMGLKICLNSSNG